MLKKMGWVRGQNHEVLSGWNLVVITDAKPYYLRRQSDYGRGWQICGTLRRKVQPDWQFCKLSSLSSVYTSIRTFQENIGPYFRNIKVSVLSNGHYDHPLRRENISFHNNWKKLCESGLVEDLHRFRPRSDDNPGGSTGAAVDRTGDGDVLYALQHLPNG